MAVFADDAHLVEWRRHADAARLALRIVAVEDCDKAFGEPVELVEAARKVLVQPVLVFLEQRRTERQDHFERREPRRVEAWGIEDRDDLRRDEHRVRDAFALDGIDEVVDVEGAPQHVSRAGHDRRKHRDHCAIEDDRA